MLHRPLGHRRNLQEHQTTARRPGTADLQRPRSRTGGGIELVAVRGGVAVVSGTKIREPLFSGAAVVWSENDAQLCRRNRVSATPSVARTNKIDVRKFGRT